MRINKYSIIILIILLSLDSCRKIEQLSNIPSIRFTSFTVFDSIDPYLHQTSKAGRLNFYFEDGDGDLGLKVPSGDQADSTNLFFTLFRKTDGIMTPAAEDDPLYPSSYRIPYMVRLGQNKILKGNISVIFYPYFSDSLSDTIRYDFYIKDRALNKSNVASTSEIVLSENKVYSK